MIPLREEHIVTPIYLNALEARVLFHIVNNVLSGEQLMHLFPLTHEQQAARTAYQKIRTLAYGNKKIA